MLSAILPLALFGFIVWLIVTYIPMTPIFKTVISVGAAIWVIIRMAALLGIPIL